MWRCSEPVARERRLEVWTDQREVVGEEWRPQLLDGIARSRAALLLVSKPFLASQFIMGQELPALIDRGVRRIPVLLRERDWQREPMLERLQWALDPRRSIVDSRDPQGKNRLGALEAAGAASR